MQVANSNNVSAFMEEEKKMETIDPSLRIPPERSVSECDAELSQPIMQLMQIH